MAELPAIACHEQIITQRFVELRRILGLNQSDYASLFKMSRQAFSKLEKFKDEQKMNYSTIFMISFTISSIVKHKNFVKMGKIQKDKIIEIKDLIDSYLSEKTLDNDIISQLFGQNNS